LNEKVRENMQSTAQELEYDKEQMEHEFRLMGSSADVVNDDGFGIDDEGLDEYLPQYVNGECLEKDCDRVMCIQGSWYYYGRLVLTNARICFIEYGRKLPSDDDEDVQPRLLFNVLLGCIDRVDVIDSNTDNNDIVNFGTKDLSSYSLGFQYSTQCSASEIRLSLIDTCILYKETDRFAFVHGIISDTDTDTETETQTKSETEKNSIDYYKDYERMGLITEDPSYFRECTLNTDYSLCSSYPHSVIIPSAMSDTDIESCVEFRSKNRFITVVWKSLTGNQVICRCAQPLSGLTRNHNTQDEKYIALIVSFTRGEGDVERERHPVLICDSRPQANAMGNMAVGGGWENMEFYNGCDFIFQNIGNIHVVRESFHGLHNMFSIKLASTTDMISHTNVVDRYASIEFSLRQGKGLATWFVHLSSVIRGARQLVEHVCHHQGSIIVHCSDGWDRTSQMTSLAQLILDPYYRTLEGFMVLIEKEWIAFGHKFAQRFGHGSGRELLDTQRSPIFIQWLDCVWQHMNRFPNEFEFKPSVLVQILDSVFSCRFGNFLCDSESERVQLGVKNNTASLWDSLLDDETIINATYNPQDSSKILLLDGFNPSNLSLWIEFFIRWDKSLLRRRDLNPTQLYNSLSLLNSVS